MNAPFCVWFEPMEPKSPLESSMRQGFSVLAGLIGVLAAILLGSAILTWTLEEGAGARGAALAAGAGLLALLAWGLARRGRARREASAGSEPTAGTPRSRWARRRLGPGWFDWASLGLPPILIGLPLLLLSERPVAEVWPLALGIVGLLELLVLGAVMSARRENVALELSEDGLLVVSRSGSRRLLPRGALVRVVLGTGQVRGFVFGRLELEVGEQRPIAFREPMDAPLELIAEQVAEHMRVPVERGPGWAARDPIAR